MFRPGLRALILFFTQDSVVGEKGASRPVVVAMGCPVESAAD
jgi:hypothetical protein